MTTKLLKICSYEFFPTFNVILKSENGELYDPLLHPIASITETTNLMSQGTQLNIWLLLFSRRRQ